MGRGLDMGDKASVNVWMDISRFLHIYHRKHLLSTCLSLMVTTRRLSKKKIY